MSATTWYFYVIRTVDDYLYAGITTDVERRFSEHTSGRGAKFFLAHRAERVELSIEVGSRSLALKVEYGFKKLSKASKEKLICQDSFIIDEDSGRLS